MERLTNIDGLRGTAISMVVLYHALYRWQDLSDASGIPEDFNIFEYGYLGVQLFFLISGFVILMTLERSKSLIPFLRNRWLRLWPCMVVVSLLVFSTSYLIPLRPLGVARSEHLIPGLIFVEPYFLNTLFNTNIQSLEGTFWSIYVEIKFYIIAAFLYFSFGSKYLPYILGTLFAIFTGLDNYTHLNEHANLYYIQTALFHLGAEHYGWFTAGTAAYCFYKQRRSHWMILALASALLGATQIGVDLSYSHQFASGVVALLFFLALNVGHVSRFFENRLFVFMGFISYPLYLIHENAMVGIFRTLSTLDREVYDGIYIVLPILGLIAISYFIARYVEPNFRNVLKKTLKI